MSIEKHTISCVLRKFINSSNKGVEITFPRLLAVSVAELLKLVPTLILILQDYAKTFFLQKMVFRVIFAKNSLHFFAVDWDIANFGSLLGML